MAVIGWILLMWAAYTHLSLRGRLRTLEKQLKESQAQVAELQADYTKTIQATAQVVGIATEIQARQTKLANTSTQTAMHHVSQVALQQVSEMAASMELDLRVARDSTAALQRAKSVLEEIEPSVHPDDFKKWMEYIDNNVC